MQQIEKETKVAFKYCYWKQDAFPIKFKPTNDLSTKTSLGQKTLDFDDNLIAYFSTSCLGK